MQKSKRKLALVLIWAIAVPVFALSQISFWDVQKVSAEDSTTLTQGELAAQEKKEKEIEDAKEEAEDLQKKIDKENKAKALLEKNLGQIQSAVFSTQKSINTTKSVIVETDTDIVRKEKEIENLSSQLVVKQEMLKNLIQQAYYVQNKPILNVILLNESLAGMFGDMQNLNSLDEKISTLIEEINAKKAQISGDKSELAKKKEEHLEILEEKTDQKQELVADQVEVQGDIQSKEQIIAKLNSELDALKNEYSKILGKSVSVKDIVEAAAFASNATKMNKSFLLGVLIQESNKGENTGNCTYAQVASGAKIAYKSGKLSKKSYDTMLYRKGIFDNIVKDLNYKESKVKVSCNPSSYTGTGGAMGIPQFMADTWEFGGGKPSYKDEIKRLTGHSKPDPWNLLDGVTAMAIKLSRDGANQKTRFAEAKSYCTYLAGGNWGYYCFGSESKYKKDYSGIDCYNSKYIKNAGEKVLCFKDNYEKYY